MTETTATVSCWDDKKFKLKSVGTLVPNMQVKIGENNEILLKGGSITKGYYNNPEEMPKPLPKMVSCAQGMLVI